MTTPYLIIAPHAGRIRHQTVVTTQVNAAVHCTCVHLCVTHVCTCVHDVEVMGMDGGEGGG